METIDDIPSYQKIGTKKFFTILRSETNLIGLQDIIRASLFLVDDAKYVQGNYRKEYLESYTKAFIMRIQEVKVHHVESDELLDIAEVQDAVQLLQEQEKLAAEGGGFDPAFFKIYKIISLYTTFILAESVHPVGTPFPGGLQVKYDGEKFLCPVKERQKDNPGAVCGFCIAEQDPETM
ncbi:DUF2115 family protein [Methanobacterium sp. BAmetb5]|uniref:DUF2115 family protein n=1 Tax=Methanobacterium sp. BAmetb5 TaxID=2025351 RepID=UPI000E8349A6|nr:DUF2115 family protein [Methanobacterium sp. BAmetb5]AXV39832.1 MAG: hypothetical protein CIT02_05645 [Methanobacterium sp. BAmetb5]